MSDWQKALSGIVHNAEEHLDKLRYRLKERLGREDRLQIVPYRGYGSRRKLYLRGRVLEDEGVTAADDNDRMWDNLLNTYRRRARG